jgi:xanthine dehydrogenase molybdopterin-binding subunit B
MTTDDHPGHDAGADSWGIGAGDNSDRQPSSIAPTEAPGCVDDLHLPGMLHGVVVRSCSAHALLEGVDYDPAFDWSSVVRVDAGAIPGVNRLAPFPPDQPVLAQGICRHVGEPVLLLAAGSRARALQARHRLRLHERPLPAIDDPAAASAARRTIRCCWPARRRSWHAGPAGR